MRYRIVLLSGMFLFLFFTACEHNSPHKLGFSGQLSGTYSNLGIQGRNGVLLALEEINSQAGVRGRKLELIEKNDKNTVVGAIEADKELVDQGVAAIIGHMTSSQTLGVLPVLKKHNIPLISPTSSSPLLMNRKDNFFSLNPSSKDYAAALGSYAGGRLDIRRAALVYDIKNEVFTLPYANELTRVFQNNGGIIDLKLTFSPDQAARWDSFIDKIEERGIKSVFMIASAEDLVHFIDSRNKKGSDIQVLSSGWAHSRELFSSGEIMMEGVLFISNYNPYSTYPGFQDFRKKYYAKYGCEPDFAAAQGYEAVLFLAEGLRRMPRFEDDLIKALSSIDRIEGVMGPVEFDEFGDVRRLFFISHMENRQWMLKDSIQGSELIRNEK